MKNSHEYRHLYVSMTSESRTDRPRSDYPDKALKAEIKNLLIRSGAEHLRPRMDAVNKMSRAEAQKLRGILYRSVIAAEQVRAEHPEGKRATGRQVEQYYRAFKIAHHQEPSPEQLAHFMNLDTKSANRAVSDLRKIHGAEQDRAGTTPEWRIRRGLYDPELVGQQQRETPADRRLSLEEMRDG
jgi:hypothetical protein